MRTVRKIKENKNHVKKMVSVPYFPRNLFRHEKRASIYVFTLSNPLQKWERLSERRLSIMNIMFPKYPKRPEIFRRNSHCRSERLRSCFNEIIRHASSYMKYTLSEFSEGCITKSHSKSLIAAKSHQLHENFRGNLTVCHQTSP